MSAPAYQPDARVRPSPWWYLAVVLAWIASFVVFVIAILPVARLLNAGVDQVRNNSTVTVPSGGVTVYSSIRPDNAQCTLTGSGGAVPMKPFDQNASSTFTFSFDNGMVVHPLASTPDNLPGGQYKLACDVPPRALLATGDRIDIGSFAPRLIIGIIVSILAGILGLVILIVTLVKRHNSKRRIRQAQAAAAYGYGGYPGYPAGGYPQGDYQQSGYQQGGYQQGGGYPQGGGYQQPGYPSADSPPMEQSPVAQSPYESPSAPPPPPPPPPPASGPPGPSDTRPDPSDDDPGSSGERR